MSSSPSLSRRQLLRSGAVAGLATAWTVSPLRPMAAALAQAPGGGPLRAGVGAADITPALGDTFFGYVRPDRVANGVAVRLWSRTLVLSDGATTIALVTVDLGASLDKADVVARVADLGFTMENVVLAATHTHAGPETWTEWLEERIATSIRRAHADLAPARAGWASTTVDDVNHNRSLSAHLANHGLDNPPYTSDLSMDPDGPDHPRDLALRLLRVERPDATPVAAWSNFAVHPTNFPNSNTLYSADLSGIAMLRFEDSFGRAPGQPPGVGAPLGILANGNEGDLISRYDAHNPHACADLMGIRLATAMRRAWDDAGAALTDDVPLAIRWTRIGYLGQEVEPGKRVADRAEWGYPMAGGAENGPSPLFATGTEGTRLPAALADPVHGRKIRGQVAPWRNDPELQVVRVGRVCLVPVPGEATVEAGRRITAAVLDAAPAGVDDATVVGLSNDYVGYFTTPEEYEQQHYEGGHTVFGTYTTLVVIQGGRELARAITDDGPAPAPAEGSAPPYPPQGGPGDAPGTGAADGRIETEPPCEVARMSVVAMRWEGGPDGLDRPVDAPFVVVERQLGDGTWQVVDSDLGVGCTWTAGGQPSSWPEGVGSLATAGLHAVTWDAPPDLPTGTHRLRVTAARYELTSAPFAVVPSTGLVPRGARREGDRLVVLAQQPAPDPERHLRHRSTSPRGGTVTFSVGGLTRTAAWDEAAQGWTAPAGGIADGDELTIPAGGLVDGAGNTSGPAVTLTVGEVADVTWPPDMAVGGTDRDWHGHTPSEVVVAERADDCAVPGGQPAPGGDGGAGSGGEGSDDGSGSGGEGGGDGNGSGGSGTPLPATGGGAAAVGAATLVAAAAVRRATAPTEDRPVG